MANQVKIIITCDEGYVADSLRQIANAYEYDSLTEFETSHCFAEISEV